MEVDYGSLSCFCNLYWSDFMPVDTTHFVKIWFNKNHAKRALGSVVNEARMIRHMERHPSPTNTTFLIVCRGTLSDEQQIQLVEFCNFYKIVLFDMEEISRELPSEGLERDLFNIAMQEIREPFGCLASASDIVRLLTPVLQRGMYTDLDFEIPEASKLPPRWQESEILFDICHRHEAYDEWVVDCNDFIAADLNSERARSIMGRYRRIILQQYRTLEIPYKKAWCTIETSVNKTNPGHPRTEQEWDSLFSPEKPNIFQIREKVSFFCTQEEYSEFLLCVVKHVSAPLKELIKPVFYPLLEPMEKLLSYYTDSILLDTPSERGSRLYFELIAQIDKQVVQSDCSWVPSRNRLPELESVIGCPNSEMSSMVPRTPTQTPSLIQRATPLVSLCSLEAPGREESEPAVTPPTSAEGLSDGLAHITSFLVLPSRNANAESSKHPATAPVNVHSMQATGPIRPMTFFAFAKEAGVLESVEPSEGEISEVALENGLGLGD